MSPPQLEVTGSASGAEVDEDEEPDIGTFHQWFDLHEGVCYHAPIDEHSTLGWELNWYTEEMDVSRLSGPFLAV